MERIEFVRKGFLDVHVCAQKNVTNEEIESFVNSEYPTGIRSQWSVLIDGPDPERVECVKDSNRVHVVLTC